MRHQETTFDMSRHVVWKLLKIDDQRTIREIYCLDAEFQKIVITQGESKKELTFCNRLRQNIITVNGTSHGLSILDKILNLVMVDF